MKISVANARLLAQALTEAADAADKSGQSEFDFSFIGSLQLADDAARAELEQAITNAGG